MNITQEQLFKLNIIKLAFKNAFVIINAREYNKMEVFVLNEKGLFAPLDFIFLSNLGIVKLSNEELENGYIKNNSHSSVWLWLATALLGKENKPISDSKMYKKFGTCCLFNSELHKILEYIEEVEKSKNYKDFLAEVDKLRADFS